MIYLVKGKAIVAQAAGEQHGSKTKELRIVEAESLAEAVNKFVTAIEVEYHARCEPCHVLYVKAFPVVK